MQAFVAPLRELAEYEAIQKSKKEKHGLIQITGCVSSQKTHFMYALGDGFMYKIIACSSETKAKQIYEEYKILGENVFQYPAKDLLFYQADLRGKYLTKQRMEVFQAMMDGQDMTIVTTFDGFMDALIPLDEMKKRVISVKVGDALNFEQLKQDMVSLGYDRE